MIQSDGQMSQVAKPDAQNVITHRNFDFPMTTKMRHRNFDFIMIIKIGSFQNESARDEAVGPKLK